ncbi:MAG: glycosyltransferase [archaeon]
MDFFTGLYLFYSFLALYYLTLFILIYIQNREQIYESPKFKQTRSLSIVVPCYNEENSIGETIQALLDSEYKGLENIIVVDDCSTDNSYEVIKNYAEKHPKVMAVQTPKNTGKASGAKNYGSQFVKTELIGFTDADSRSKKDAINHMIGYFEDPKVGAVTSRVLVKNRERFIANLQAIEYKIIAFTRKLFGFIDSIYVTNGPLSIYPKKVFDEVGGFDESNMTEDIEITWHIAAKGYKVHMAIPAKAYTVVPDKIKGWYRQRIRWNVGGIQTVVKYRKYFLKSGMLGLFIIPFFVSAWILGITGLGILGYRFGRYFIVQYLSAKYSIAAETAILSLNEINLAPNILFFFGIILLVMGISYNLLALSYSREKEYKHKIWDYVFYTLIYLLFYPIILITSLIRYFRGNYQW